MLRRTDRPSHEEMSVKHKGWLSQGAVISLRKPKGGDGWQWRFRKNESGMLCLRYHVYRGLPGPRLSFMLGGSAEGVQRIGSGSSTRSKKLVILAAIALEHSSQFFSHARDRERVLGIFSNHASPFAIFLTSIF